MAGTCPAWADQPGLIQSWDPARKSLAEAGITYNLLYFNDVLANVHGGDRRGAIYQGKLEGSLSVDLHKLAGLPGLSFYGNVFQIHNTGRMRRDYVGGLNTIAAIEAMPATRLSELWFEQKVSNGAASVRFGQLVADGEFFFAGISSIFLQSDWATIAAANMPSGGPAYPLSTPGVRIKADPSKESSVLFAVFNGDPAGPGSRDEQLRNRHGLNFRIADAPLVIAEGQLRTNHGQDDAGLARTIKLGGWAHFGSFEDQRLAEDGTLLADPSGSGVAARRNGNWGIYGVVEQQVYRPSGGDAESGVSLFSRVAFSPSDRNQIGLFVDGGIVFAGMIPSRPHDKFGASLMLAQFSGNLRDYDQDLIAFAGHPDVVRDFEMNLELTYVTQIAPGWIVQPVLTRIWHPNGDASRDALVTGLRSILRF